jgi:hypothetical protein
VIASLALAHAGFVALCLGMDRHHRQVLGARPSPSRARALRAGGWLVLAASYAASVAEAGPSVGTVAWIGALTLGAGVIVLLLPYAPRALRLSAGLALVAGVAALGA